MTVDQALRELLASPQADGPAWKTLTGHRAQAVASLERLLGKEKLTVQRAALALLGRLGHPPLAALRSEQPRLVSEALTLLEAQAPPTLDEELRGALGWQNPNVLAVLAPVVLRRWGWRGLAPLCRRLHVLKDDALAKVGEALLAQLQRDPGPAWGALVHQLDDAQRAALERCLEEPWRRESWGYQTDPDLYSLDPFGVVLESPSRVDVENPTVPPGYLPLHPEPLRVARERLTEGKPGHLLVVGPSGVGKTVFLHHLFSQVSARHGFTVLETSTGILVAGMKYIGEWQGNLRKLVQAATRPKLIILYFTDLMNLTTAGVSEGNTENFGSFLKPWMERGEITVVGEATPEQMVHLRRHPDVVNLFQEVVLEAPTAAEMPAVVRTVVPELEAEFGKPIDLEDHTLERMVELSDLYVPGLAFPGKTLDLLRRVVRDQARQERIALTSDHLIGALAGATGLPRWLLDDATPLELARTKAFFDERIVGQPEGVKTVVDLITLIKAGLTDPKRPLAVLFFVGPTGVGKTETAKALAEYIFGSPDRLLRFDMSEFKDYEAYQRLIGGHYGGGDGLLTRRVREQPFSVVLLDEFEKAHPNVYDLMLQVFDDGRLTSGRGEVVSFRQTVVIMTSNLGSGISQAGSLGLLNRPAEGPSARTVLKAVEEYFRPEFLNRIQLVHFQALDLNSMQQIARRELESVLQRSGIRRRELTVDVADDFLSLLLRQGFHAHYGARPLKRALEQLLLLPLARKLVASPGRGGLVQVNTRGDEVKVRLLAPAEPTVRPEEAREARTLEALRALLAQSRATLAEAPEEKARLVEASGQEGFWEEPAAARQCLSRIRRLETLLEGQRELEERCERAPEAAEGLVQRVELWHRRLTHGEDEQRDAFLSVRGLEGEAPAGRLATMLTSFAERMRLEVTPLGESLWWVSGPCAYGLLRGEHGLHRYKPRGKRSRLVRVDVLSAAPPDYALGDVQVSARRRKGGSWARAVHVPSVTVVEVSNELEPDENQAIVRQLLAARLWQTAPEGELVRGYYEEAGEVRDVASGRRARLESVLAGELEGFHL